MTPELNLALNSGPLAWLIGLATGLVIGTMIGRHIIPFRGPR